jgi:hypothetical protein
MKSAVRVAGALLLSCAGASLAQSPFDGTWKIDQSKTKHETKPIAAYLAQGWYHCESCVPTFAIKADGTDQPVTGQSVDTISVKEADAKSISFVGKKNQKVVYEVTATVSADGKTLTRKGVYYAPNSDKPNNGLTTWKRIGVAPSGVHAASGQWQVVNTTSDEEAMLTTYKTNGDELTLTRPGGETYTAKFDGNEYPVKGSYVYDTISLKRLGERSFEETDKLKGKLVEIDTWTVSNDGKTLTTIRSRKAQRPQDHPRCNQGCGKTGKDVVGFLPI